MTVVSSRNPALDSVTSSRSAVPVGVPPGATPATAAVVREPVSETASHSRMPRAAMASGCNRTTPRRESNAEVFSLAVSRRWLSGGSDAAASVCVISAARPAQPEPQIGSAPLRSCRPPNGPPRGALLWWFVVPYLRMLREEASGADGERDVYDVGSDDH